MTVIELRDELNKLIEAGLGNTPVQIWASPDIDGDYQDVEVVDTLQNGNIRIY
jgi:hypothetical protein